MNHTAETKKSDAALAQHNLAMAELAQAILAMEELAQAILETRAGCYGSSWADVGTAAHVRAILAQAALAAGAITEEQAVAHGA